MIIFYDIRKRFKEKHAQLFEQFPITEGDIKSLSFDLVHGDDGGYGPYKYLRIGKGKKLIIETTETYDEDYYANTPINGYEFLLLGEKDDYSNYDLIVECIQTKGATITTELTRETKYVVFPEKKEKTSRLNPAVDDLDRYREECIPLISENAFAYRWLGVNLDELIDEDFRDWVYKPNFNCAYLKWFEKWGYGEVTLFRWKNGEWKRV